MILNDTFVELGYIAADYSSDPNRNCGIWNGGSFIFVRAAFLPITLLLSWGNFSRIRVIEWPWAFLVLAILVPAALDGLPKAEFITATHAMDLRTFALRKVKFVQELCPYYFVY